MTNSSWRVDEAYIKVKGIWMYLYRAVDSDGNTIEFMLSSIREEVSELRARNLPCDALSVQFKAQPQ